MSKEYLLPSGKDTDDREPLDEVGKEAYAVVFQYQKRKLLKTALCPNNKAYRKDAYEMIDWMTPEGQEPLCDDKKEEMAQRTLSRYKKNRRKNGDRA